MGGIAVTNAEFDKLKADLMDAGVIIRVKRQNGKTLWKTPDVMPGFPQPPIELMRRVDAAKSDLAKYILGLTEPFKDAFNDDE